MTMLSATEPFRNRLFRSLWLANISSTLGVLMQTVAAAWLVATIADTADLVALVQTAAAAPILLLSLPSGAIADNFHRRDVMLVAHLMMFLLTALLAAAAYMGTLNSWLLLLFTFLIGCGPALHQPSLQATVGDVVPQCDLPSAVALTAIGANVARATGPALGGGIVLWSGAPAAFAVSATCYLLMIGVLLRWPLSPVASTLPKEGISPAIIAGLRYIARSPGALKIMLRASCYGFTSIAVLALLPIVSRDLLHGDSLLYGLLFAAFGAGAIAGGLVSSYVRLNFLPEWIMRLSFLTSAVCAGTVALSTNPWITTAIMALGGASWLVGFSNLSIFIHISTPRWVAGRVLAVLYAVSYGGIALGGWAWGVAADAYGADNALLIATIAMTAGAALGVQGFALPKYPVVNLEPLDIGGINDNPGPSTDRKAVHVQVEYRVPETEQQAFLAAATEKRRICLRDGARQWKLLHDQASPERWVESYRLLDWADYLRHRKRATGQDQTAISTMGNYRSGVDNELYVEIIG